MYQQNTNLVLGSNTNHPSQNKFMNSEWCHQCKQRSNNVIHCGQGCNKKFCSRCLLRHYGEQDRDINIENWQCPFCKKICCCAYCRRNKDKLISSASNSLNSSNILGYGGNKNLYRKGGMGLYPLQKSEGSLKRDRDEDYLANYGDDYEDDYEQSDPEEDDGMMKRGQLNYGMNNRGGGINNMNNMGHLYKQNNNNNLLVDPRGYNNNPNYNNNNTGYYNNNGPPINNNINNNNSSNNNNDNTNPNHISVPIAFRVVPLQTPTTTNNNNNSNSGNNNSNSNPSSDLLKLASTNDEYEWNPNKEEWMGTLFSHDLHDYGSLHVSDYPTGGGVKSNNRQDMYHSRAEGTQTGYSKSSRGNSGDSNDVYSQGGVGGGYNNYGGRNDMMFKSNQERKGGRSLKKSVDYDSDYEYPDEQEMLQQQQQKEQKYYMDPQQQQHQQPQQHIQQQQQQHQPQQLHKPKPAHLVNNNNNSNNNNHHPYGHPGYIYHHNADNFLPDHDFQQRQMDVKRSRLPAHAVSVLKDWFFKHSHSPYPTEEEKEKFTKELSLTILQVNNWFTNARRRLLPDRI